jgi:hypothetical protein
MSVHVRTYIGHQIDAIATDGVFIVIVLAVCAGTFCKLMPHAQFDRLNEQPIFTKRQIIGSGTREKM